MALVKAGKGKKLELIARSQRAPEFRVPPRPAELPGEMGKEWAQVCRNLNAEGLWHSDRAALVAAYLYQVWLMRQAAMVIAQDGAFVDGKAHPAQTAHQKSLVAALSCAKTLGLSVTAAQIANDARTSAEMTPKSGGWAKAGAKG